jgi:hypothetical protein
MNCGGGGREQVKGNKTSQDMAEALHDVVIVVKHLATRGGQQIYWAQYQILDGGLAIHSKTYYQHCRVAVPESYSHTCHCAPGTRIFIGTAQNTHHQILKAF